MVPILKDEFKAAGAISELVVERQVRWAEAARRAQELSSDVRQKVAAADLEWTDITTTVWLIVLVVVLLMIIAPWPQRHRVV